MNQHDHAERYHALAEQWSSGHLSPKDAAARVSLLLAEVVPSHALLSQYSRKLIGDVDFVSESLDVLRGAL